MIGHTARAGSAAQGAQLQGFHPATGFEDGKTSIPSVPFTGSISRLVEGVGRAGCSTNASVERLDPAGGDSSWLAAAVVTGSPPRVSVTRSDLHRQHHRPAWLVRPGRRMMHPPKTAPAPVGPTLMVTSARAAVVISLISQSIWRFMCPDHESWISHSVGDVDPVSWADVRPVRRSVRSLPTSACFP